MKIFNLPDLGEGLPDAEIVEWFVKEGDDIEQDAPLVAMETAKAVVDVPSPYQGKILKLHGAAGDIIKTGAALVDFDIAGDATQDSAVLGRSTGTVAGKIESSDIIIKEEAISVSKQSVQVKATPAIRALAKKLNVDLSQVTASGPNGTITQADVKRAGEALADAGELEPLRGTRRTMAQIMQKAHAKVVPVNVMDEAYIYTWNDSQDITARIIRAVCIAVKKEPALNAWYDEAQVGVRKIEQVNLGLAMDTPDGLFVPVIQTAEKFSLNELREEINSLKKAVGDRSIPAEKLKHPSITLSNFGNFAGRYATPVVVPPTVAIIGVGKLFEKVIAVDAEVKISKCIPVSLTFDHRAITGGEATRFLGALIEDLTKAN